MRLIKLYSKTCGPCKVLEKVLQLSGLPYDSVDIETYEGEELVDMYNIRAVPTLLLIDDIGKLLNKHTGLLTLEDLNKFYNYGNN